MDIELEIIGAVVAGVGTTVGYMYKAFREERKQRVKVFSDLLEKIEDVRKRDKEEDISHIALLEERISDLRGKYEDLSDKFYNLVLIARPAIRRDAYRKYILNNVKIIEDGLYVPLEAIMNWESDDNDKAVKNLKKFETNIINGE